MLLAGSLIFYAIGELKYLVLLMVSVLINYIAGLHLEQMPRQKGKQNKQKKNKYDRKRKRIFIAAIVTNIGLLAVCKAVLDEDALPLGVSFYTFQVLSYLIDVYRGEQKKEKSFVCFATYITMFPKLVSGPITGYGEVRESLHERKFDMEKLQEGLKLFTMGLAAKVLLADRLGLLWREVQVTGFESISTPLAWLAAAAYSMKI